MSAVVSYPFNFYGGYMMLNTKEKVNLVESNTVTYYKDCIIELEMKNQVLEQEIYILKDMNVKYGTENTHLRS